MQYAIWYLLRKVKQISRFKSRCSTNTSGHEAAHCNMFSAPNVSCRNRVDVQHAFVRIREKEGRVRGSPKDVSSKRHESDTHTKPKAGGG